MLPAGLIFLGILSAAAVGWGCDSRLAEWMGGIGVTRVMFRLQWVMVLLVVSSALSLVGLVVTGRRRGWWLIGLAPVLAIFAWRFGISPEHPGVVDEQAAFVPAGQVNWFDDNDAVLGVFSGDQPYAYPLAAMQRTPVVVSTERDRRLVVCWSEGAGIAAGFCVDRLVRGRDLQVVSSPHGVLLICNRRLGEFFDGLTLRSAGGSPIQGWMGRLTVELTTWGQWRAAHPETLLLQLADVPQPTPPPPPPVGDEPRLIYIASDEPILIPADELGTDPANVGEGHSTALLLRDGGQIRAFDRRVQEDLFPRFSRNSDRSRKGVELVDSDTGSGWTATGACVEGPLKGSRLRRLVVVEHVSASAARFWLGK